MGKIFNVKLIVILVLLSFSTVICIQAENLSGLKLGGYLQTDNRVLLKNERSEFSWQEYRMSLKAEAKSTDTSDFYSEIWLRTLGFSAIQNSSDLSISNDILPLNIQVREAYINIYGIFLENLDLRIGRQRIAWGTADTLNPTDNLNPDDLEDIWDFGRHLGSDAFKAVLYLEDFRLEAVFIPVFTPAVLPRGSWAAVLSPAMELPPGMILRNLTDVVIMPENNFSESSITGIKLSKNLFGYDFSISYIYGRDDLPIVNTVKFTPTGGAPGEVDIESKLMFPRMNIVGADMSGAIATVGVWAEAAMFIPEKITLITDLSDLGMGTSESIVLDGNPYVRYVVGADYTFENGLYVNAQYVHGFIHERGEENLENYFMFGVELKTMEDKLKIVPLGGGVVIKDFQDIENKYAYIYSPEISYAPVDNAEIKLGARWIEGTDATAFGSMREFDETYLKVKYSF